jgi:hypothetical protein
VLSSLADKDLLLPYFRNAVLSKKWPDSYTVTIDSSPYYGHGDGMFHPSTHALMGARELYYRFHPDHRDKLLHEVRNVQAEMTLAMGSALHGIIQTQFQMAGLIRSEEDVEIEYVLDEHRVRGRADFRVHHPDGNVYICELKTQNSRGFDLQNEIKPSWDAQLSMALHALGQPTGVLLVLESGYPYRMKEYRVNRNDALLSEIFDKFAYVRECIATNTPPEHCCPLDSIAMKSCPARYECWLKGQVVTE